MSDWKAKELTRQYFVGNYGSRFKDDRGRSFVQIERAYIDSVRIAVELGGVMMGVNLTPDTAEEVGKALIEYAEQARKEARDV